MYEELTKYIGKLKPELSPTHSMLSILLGTAEAVSEPTATVV